jgi:hypothetical protein
VLRAQHVTESSRGQQVGRVSEMKRLRIVVKTCRQKSCQLTALTATWRRGISVRCNGLVIAIFFRNSYSLIRFDIWFFFKQNPPECSTTMYKEESWDSDLKMQLRAHYF